MTSPAPTFIYFIAPVGGGPVKIGFSADPRARMKRLSESAPFQLQVLCAVPGTRDDERRLHAEFATAHAHREWFHPAPNLLDFIAQVGISGSLPAEMRRRPVPRRCVLRRSVGKRTPEQCARIAEGVRIHHAKRHEAMRIAFEEYERGLATQT